MSHLKFFIGVVLFGLCSRFSLAQESLQSRFGIQISYGNPGYIPSFADGAPSYEGKNFFDFGFLYLKPISDKWEFETGLFYSSNRFRVTPTIPIGFPNDPYILTMNNWVLPANFRLWLPKDSLSKVAQIYHRLVVVPLVISGLDFHLDLVKSLSLEISMPC